MDYVLNAITSPIKNYIASSLQYYLSKYLKDVKVEGIGVLNEIKFEEIEINCDKLQEDLKLPFIIIKGTIKNLNITIPWLSITYDAISVKFKYVEIILDTMVNPNEYKTNSFDIKPPPPPQQIKGNDEKGWFSNILTKILSNISVTIDNLIVKLNHRDIIFTVSLTKLNVYSCNENNKWSSLFCDLNDPLQTLCKCVEIKEFSFSINSSTDYPPIIHRFDAILHMRIPFERKLPDSSFNTDKLVFLSSNNVLIILLYLERRKTKIYTIINCFSYGYSY